MVFVTADGYAYVRRFCGVPSGLFNTQYLDSFGNLFLIIDGLLEFGFTPDEILLIMFFIMGDDNCGFTHWQIGKLHQFTSFFEEYAKTRYNMVLSKTKSIITCYRDRIETLSYRNNNGMPIRPLGKLVAQLCYPERGTKDKYMSARAIGIAYAAAGMNPTFHEFCHDIYLSFLPYAAPIDEHTLPKITPYLPGAFKAFDSIEEIINFTRFPNLTEVRDAYKRWQGPLDFDKKWLPAHFRKAPNDTPYNYVTIADYRAANNIARPEVMIYF
jgi:hypothetical protein